ncbi:TetR family transcriptional regulator [Cellulomonas sp. WB94]|nr:TetR family transcriptional regulator [Cellulomonas sp. WB94]
MTLAAVAARAGVAVPSLYKHVGGLSALRLEVARLCVDDLTAALADAGRGLAGAPAVRAIMHATRAFAHAQPGRYQATQGAWAQDPTATAVQAAGARTVAVIADAVTTLGVDPARTIDAVRAFRSTLHGFVTLELAGGFGMPRDVDESFAYAVELLVTALPARLTP